MTKWISPDQIAGLLRPDMRVFVGGTTSEPAEILQALQKQGDSCAGVNFVSVTIPGINEFDFTSLNPWAKPTAFFATGASRDAIAQGRVAFKRLSYREVYQFLEDGPAFDLALVQLPPVNDIGDVSMGLGADFLPAVIDRAGAVVGEINVRQPVPGDAPTFSRSRLDYAVECDRPVATLPPPRETEVSQKIARHVAALIEDGDCLQVGIGAIPNAVLAALGHKNDLGCHSGLVSDGMMNLAEAGVLTGANKGVDRGKMVAPAVLGSEELINWAGATDQLMIRPVNYTHDARVIGGIRQFVSINSALEVDLAGRVNVDTIGGKLVSGPGGALDFTRGAAYSHGGKAIIAMSSTAAGGKVSRIVPELAADAPVTIPGAETDYVVTEYGARRVKGLPADARAGVLAEIAHPKFREGLQRASID